MKRSELRRKTPLKSHKELKRSWAKHKPSKVNAEYTRGLRLYIAERDECCRICGGRGDQVHHVIPRGRYKVHPDRYLLNSVHDERNLMFICWACHDRINVNRNGELEYAIEIQEQRFGRLRKDFG